MSAILLKRESINSFVVIVLLALALVDTAAQTPGKDGAKTVSGTETINVYQRLTRPVAAGATQIRVTSNAAFSAGDLILIYQAQGAALDWASNTPSYGAVSAIGNAGNYEFQEVLSTGTGGRINLTKSLAFAYDTASKAQAVRVPQYTTLTVNASGSIQAASWDGNTGGIIAAVVQGQATINGSINANGRGFRGGALSTNSGSTAFEFISWRSSSRDTSAEKGESIGGSTAIYAANNGRYGRGAPANGGGGGNGHNGGGGGGANGGSVARWTGHGVMCTSCTGSSAWSLDPAYIANGNTFTTSSGGGRGGYTYGANNADALTAGPGNAAWAGHNRRERGGLGGRPLDDYTNPCNRVFFGGGGGAGNHNDASGGAGGSGGGLIILYADGISGTGSITANGNPGVNTNNGHNDAPGGGGAGGSIILSCNTLTSVSITANGGKGGDQLITSQESEGNGGGGGGGYIATTVSGGTRTATGGANGVSSSTSVTEFPANGATGGSDGTVTSMQFCLTTLPVELVSFSANRIDGKILLMWRTATESNNAGFEIERRTGEDVWRKIGFVPGFGTSSTPQRYAFEELDPCTAELRYRLRQIDRDGSVHYSSTVVLLQSDATGAVALSHYPDPFTSGTVLTYSLPIGTHVTLNVFDALGRVVARLTSGEMQEAGRHSLRFESGDLPPGVYHGVLETPLGIRTTRMLRVR